MSCFPRSEEKALGATFLWIGTRGKESSSLGYIHTSRKEPAAVSLRKYFRRFMKMRLKMI